MLGKVDAVILAGGLGSRLRSVVLDRPKPMAEINGRPFLLYLFDQLIDIGLSRVIVSTGYLGDYFSRELKTKYRGLDICYSKEEVSLGTGGALKLAAKELTYDNVLVMNGDSFLEIDFVDFLNCHCHWKAGITMALTKVDDHTEFGQVEVDLFGRIIRFEEKRLMQEGANLVNAGRYLIRKDVIENIPGNYPLSLERDFFPTLVGKEFYGYKTSGRFIDIGTPQALKRARSVLGGDN